MSTDNSDFKQESERNMQLDSIGSSTRPETKDLKGTTSARARRMSREERSLVLLKRKLRNRASAVRSRRRRIETIEHLYSELIQLSLVASRLEDRLRALESVQYDTQHLVDNKHLNSVAFQEGFHIQEPLVLLFDTYESFSDYSPPLSDEGLESYFNLDLNYPHNSI